jgi:transposase
MTYQIISCENVEVKYTLFDFLDEPATEELDCRTIEGKRRYREIFGRSFSNGRTVSKTGNTSFEEQLLDRFTLLADDIQFLYENMDERQRRLFTGFLAKVSESGGETKLAKVTGMARKTIRNGRKELETRGRPSNGRIRAPGGGRPTKMESDPQYQKEIQSILDEDLAGDPMNGRKWVRKTLRKMKEDLKERGVNVAISTIRETLNKLGITLKQNMKTRSIVNHPQRDEQFQYINKLKGGFLTAGKPVISVDSKKKEQIGNFKNTGKTWRKEAYQTLDHDFPSYGSGILIPFGIYDLLHNRAYVYGGTSSETSQFIVEALSRWWIDTGQYDFMGQSELLILCDSGGANGYRRRGWKWELQTQFADRFGLTVTICHYPPGTSKWNPIEHRLFSFISLNWAGEPLTSYDKALAFIRSTKTSKGLTVAAHLLTKEYQKGLKVSDDQMRSLNLLPHHICPKFNYTIHPQLFSPVLE